MPLSSIHFLFNLCWHLLWSSLSLSSTAVNCLSMKIIKVLGTYQQAFLGWEKKVNKWCTTVDVVEEVHNPCSQTFSFFWRHLSRKRYFPLLKRLEIGLRSLGKRFQKAFHSCKIQSNKVLEKVFDNFMVDCFWGRDSYKQENASSFSWRWKRKSSKVLSKNWEQRPCRTNNWSQS